MIPHNPPPSQGHALLGIVEDWVARLIADPKSKPGQILSALRRLELMREFPMRQAVAAARIELQQRSMAHREALRQDRLADKAEKKARQAAKEAAAAEKAKTPRKAKATSVATDAAECKTTAPANDKKVEEPIPSTEEASETTANPGTPQTTEELHAMEWDLRSAFDFGDLRPFEFCIGTQMIRFPNRSGGQPQINYPVGFKSSSDIVPRADEYLILPHVLPPAFAASAKAKRESRTSTRQRIAPILKEGRPDWSHFVKPLSTGVWPDNTVLPQDWQYGDPIPGMAT